jgi:hypothetical protein
MTVHHLHQVDLQAVEAPRRRRPAIQPPPPHPLLQWPVTQTAPVKYSKTVTLTMTSPQHLCILIHRKLFV